MEDYTYAELRSMVEWQHDKIAALAEEVEHLNEVCTVASADYNRHDALFDELFPEDKPEEETLEYRLRKRAEIRRQISTRKSVQEGAPDRIADLLEEAAAFVATVRENM